MVLCYRTVPNVEGWFTCREFGGHGKGYWWWVHQGREKPC